MALLLSLVLRGGVLLAALLTLLGGAGELALRGAEPAQAVLGSPVGTWDPRALLPQGLQGSPRAFLKLGLEVLLLTPLARVALSAALFALERDGFYTGVALWVLTLLLLSLLGKV
ncbi:MAG: DUF1634 domain-containing protein [Thermus sp.]|uniref:DUF1634 domain-containing protein n=1 Tax=Thermus sp. TaxID=275 RepID=UPI003D13D1AF